MKSVTLEYLSFKSTAQIILPFLLLFLVVNVFTVYGETGLSRLVQGVEHEIIGVLERQNEVYRHYRVLLAQRLIRKSH